MNPQKLEHFKKRLLDEKKEVMETLERMEEHHGTHASLREYTEELSAYDNHPADLGTEMFMVEMQNNLENNEKYRVREIERALEKMDNGTYGECDICGSHIDEDRLEIMPEAHICIACADKKLPMDAFNADRGRPVEEELLYPPFERTNMDGEDYTGFDGEDSYQAVAKYNQVKNDPSEEGINMMGVYDVHPVGTVEETDEITELEYYNQLYTGDMDRKFHSNASIKLEDVKKSYKERD
ncbi:TraR/DksA C4-type zinc finger protein [Alkaliphilus hydrothermalis]|uniref:YteA family regulatory protein n=1 Tax=Alkaliphilus hydrothermalis TaxID=1482730 RepID=A0ABS2NNM2_9FIRM|nr:TraR/DksA C4-type zinc finger protein [Alkaliphilus hydrothermalis]MBM7614530.1 YteA family regulatory protein [Alkaliphilus hydrothermalis]